VKRILSFSAIAITVMAMTGCANLQPARVNTYEVPAPTTTASEDLPAGHRLADEMLPDEIEEVNITTHEDLAAFADEALDDYAIFYPYLGQDVLISADLATQGLLSAYEAYIEFHENGEGPSQIIFISGVVITKFNYIALSLNPEGLYFYKSHTIYTVEELLPERPFVVNWRERDPLPHRGISFIDAHNRQRYFYLITDGITGQILLEEFWPGESLVSG